MSARFLVLAFLVAAPSAFAAGHWQGEHAPVQDDLSTTRVNSPIIVRPGTGAAEAVRYLSGVTGAEVWLKVEGDNPTGSFKDRGMTAAISHAKHLGAQAVVCASTGNTSASMAAYAAKAGLKPLVPAIWHITRAGSSIMKEATRPAKIARSTRVVATVSSSTTASVPGWATRL